MSRTASARTLDERCTRTNCGSASRAAIAARRQLARALGVQPGDRAGRAHDVVRATGSAERRPHRRRLRLGRSVRFAARSLGQLVVRYEPRSLREQSGRRIPPDMRWESNTLHFARARHLAAERLLPRRSRSSAEAVRSNTGAGSQGCGIPSSGAAFFHYRESRKTSSSPRTRDCEGMDMDAVANGPKGVQRGRCVSSTLIFLPLDPEQDGCPPARA